MRSISVCLILASLVSGALATAQQQEVSTDLSGQMPHEIVVTGRQPGPPMWKVIKGDNTLGIFAHLTPIPKDMIRESAKVEAVIAESQVYPGKPQANATVYGGDVIRKIERLVKRNRDMERVAIKTELMLEGSFSTLAKRVESWAVPKQDCMKICKHSRQSVAGRGRKRVGEQSVFFCHSRCL